MNFFDILIGNQDRHPYNWMVLFKSASEQKFSTIYDNGASLGFRFDDQQLHTYVSDPNKLEKYMRKSTVKGGLFERKRVKSLEMAKYLYTHYRIESQEIIDRIKHFEFEQFNGFIDSQNVLTEMQKEWLKVIVSFRSQTLLKWLQEEE